MERPEHPRINMKGFCRMILGGPTTSRMILEGPESIQGLVNFKMSPDDDFITPGAALKMEISDMIKPWSALIMALSALIMAILAMKNHYQPC